MASTQFSNIMANKGSSNPWVVSAEDRSKYESNFYTLNPVNGFISGNQAKNFFLSSNLPHNILGRIWKLADIDGDGKLTLQEFTIAMHLLQNKIKGVEPPTSLPPTLKLSALAGASTNVIQPIQTMPSQMGQSGGLQSVGMQSGGMQSGGMQSGGMQSGGMQAGGMQSGGMQAGGMSNGMMSFSMGQPLMNPPTSQSMGWSNMSNTGMFGISSSGFTSSTPAGFTTSNLSASWNMGMPGGTMTTNMGSSNTPGIMSTSSLKPEGGSNLRRAFSMSTSGTYSTGGENMTTIPPGLRLKYNQMFKVNDPEKKGFMTGDEARKILIQSQLSQQALAQIWILSDYDRDGKLSMDEFAVAMHLVEMLKAGHQLPQTLPDELLPESLKRVRSGSGLNFEVRDRSDSDVSQDGQRSRSGSTLSDDGDKEKKRIMFTTFEDKRKMNFEKGRLELERRRQDLQDKLRRESEERLRKEQQEEDRRMRAKLEAEQRRQAEIDKQRQQQLEMEREQEALRKKMIQQRLQQQLEAERQRQLEWEKRRKEELMNQKNKQSDVVNGLKVQAQKLRQDLDNFNQKKSSLEMSVNQQKQNCVQSEASIKIINQSRELRLTELNRIQSEIKECQYRIGAIGMERERLASTINRTDTDKPGEAYGNAFASLQDSRATIQRLQASRANMEKEVESKLKELDIYHGQLKQVRSSVIKLSDENDRLQHIVDQKQKEYHVYKRQQEEEMRRKHEEDERKRREVEAVRRQDEDRRRRAQEEARRQKERELEAMKLEQERQKKDQEMRRRIQLAQEAESRKQAERQQQESLMTKDRLVRQQGEMLAKPLPYTPPISTATSFPAPKQQDSGPAVFAQDSMFKPLESKREKLKKYKALYPFDPRNPDELRLEEGDIVMVSDVQKKAPPGWFEGEHNGKKGLFPTNYVEEIPEPEIKVKAPLPPQPVKTAPFPPQLLTKSTPAPPSAKSGPLPAPPSAKSGPLPAPPSVKSGPLPAPPSVKSGPLPLAPSPTPTPKAKPSNFPTALLPPTSKPRPIVSQAGGQGLLPPPASKQRPTQALLPPTSKPRPIPSSACASVTTSAPVPAAKPRPVAAKAAFEETPPFEASFDTMSSNPAQTQTVTTTTTWSSQYENVPPPFVASFDTAASFPPPTQTTTTTARSAQYENVEIKKKGDQPQTATGGPSVSSLIASLSNKLAFGGESTTLAPAPQKPEPAIQATVMPVSQTSAAPVNQMFASSMIQRSPTPELGPKTESGAVAPEDLIAVALYAWRGKKDDHLSFNKNDVIDVIEQQDIWLLGELGGKTGWFPKSYVKLSTGGTGKKSQLAEPTDNVGSTTPEYEEGTLEGPMEESPSNAQVICECVAMYDYPGEEGDLCFLEGDVINVTKTDGEWWEGFMGNSSGLFPANYVKKREPEPVVQKRSKPELATVIQGYTAQSDDQLTVRPGQIIQVRQKNSDGWWEGELQARGKKKQLGWFPASHVKVLGDRKGTSEATTPVDPQPVASQPVDSGIYDTPSTLMKSIPAPEKLDQVLAMFPYTAQNEDELTFYKGSVINVMDRAGDWWKGELNGTIGVFPCNYVQDLGDLPASTTQWIGNFDAALLESMSNTERKRQNYIYELINTEQTYMDDLSLTLEVFYNPLAEQGVLSEQELQTIFVNWRELISCNMKLLKSFLVRKKMSETSQLTLIGDILLEHFPRLTVYIRFCSCMLMSCQLIQSKCDNDPEFKQIEKKCAKDPRASGLPLSSYLLKPVQRITKYPLLIQEILKYTPEDHADRVNLEMALEKAEELCQQVNEGVRSQENSNRLEWLQSHVNVEGLGERLVFNSSTNCLGHRKILHSGTLFKYKSGKELKAFLFNDFLLFTRPNLSITDTISKKMGKDSSDADVQYTVYRKPLILNEVVIKLPQNDEGEENIFNLSHIDRVYTLKTETKKERNNWVEKIKNASENYIETEKMQRQKAYRTRSFRMSSAGKLVVTLIDGCNLKASDPNGFSDPYCEVNMGSQEHTTKVVAQSLNPKWNSTFHFIIKDLQQDVLCITVFDKDFFSPDDFLGRTELRIADLLKDGKGPWTKKLKLYEVTRGEVSVRIELQLSEEYLHSSSAFTTTRKGSFVKVMP